ncbi:MAG: 1-acyl-sn-glycerol-3-phosphate acyltransferase [Candidatus Polarisedimenticolaceae bacterium]|nr:1-acyl-sn-glycerol-3-phosphate acyltransferase [Candidatus Polarisedimenticolaceae bacterium]
MNSLVDSYFAQRLPTVLRKPWFERTLKKIMALDQVDSLLSGLSDQHGFELVDSLIEQTGHQVEYQGVEHIPQKGRLIIVANHPVGAADLFFMLQALGRVRKDVKVVINKFGAALIPNLTSLCLPVDSYSKFNDAARQKITVELRDDHAVILFPAGGISKLTAQGIQDHHWKTGAVHFSRTTNSTLLPCHISGRMSWLFLLLPRALRSFLVAREMLTPVSQQVVVKFGQPIQADKLSSEDALLVMKQLREQTYALK